MSIIKVPNSYEDDRGIIKDILSHIDVDAVTIITSKQGSTRANHFHKETIQWNYILSGKVKYIYQKENEEVNSRILVMGDLIKTEVLEKHTLYALEDSIILVMTKGPRAGGDYELDTFRLDHTLSHGQEGI